MDIEPITKAVEDETIVEPAAEDRGVPKAPDGEDEPTFYLDAPDVVEGAVVDEDESATADAPDDDIRTLIAAQERTIADLREAVARIAPRPGDGRKAEPAPPKPIEELTSAQDWAEYLEWRLDSDRAGIRQEAQTEARATASEQRARGLFSESAIGKGGDYDTMVGRYIAPIEKANPRMREVFATFDDPAEARYLLAQVLAVQDAAKGDTVKAVRNLRAALSGKSRGGAELVKKINTAQARGEHKVGLRPRRSGPAGIKLDADYLKNLSPRDYLKQRTTILKLIRGRGA